MPVAGARVAVFRTLADGAVVLGYEDHLAGREYMRWCRALPLFEAATD